MLADKEAGKIIRVGGRSPCRAAAVGQSSLVRAVRVHHIERRAHWVVPQGGEDNFAAVWRPSRRGVPRRVIRQAGLIHPIGIHDIDLGLSVAAALKDNLRPVGREAWARIEGTGCQSPVLVIANTRNEYRV